MSNIAVAMSGGVDSSVAAYLLKTQGHSLLGLTMSLFAPCGGKDGIGDARHVADFLGFPHQVLNFEKDFRQQVMDYFATCYESGETPNPCIVCNKKIKLGRLLEQALEMGCDAMATGHYAQVCQDIATGRYLLKKAVYPEKDQSYFLYALNQHQLSHTLFPLGGLSKPQIREIAQAQNLVNANRGDSQDVCFIPDGDYGGFIRRFREKNYPQGDFVTPDGKILGQHTGIVDYTLGQRRGLGISAESRLYVQASRSETNQVVLSDNQSLFASGLIATDLNLIATDRLDTPISCGVRIRSTQREQPAIVEQIDQDSLQIKFQQPQRAITPGQAVVLYDGDTVIGGGVIRAVL